MIILSEGVSSELPKESDYLEDRMKRTSTPYFNLLQAESPNDGPSQFVHLVHALLLELNRYTVHSMYMSL